MKEGFNYNLFLQFVFTILSLNTTGLLGPNRYKGHLIECVINLHVSEIVLP